MYRIAVLDDEVEEQDNMTQLLRCYAASHSVSFEIAAYEDGADFLEDFRDQYDIIFCDIRMKFTDGMTAARQIREKNSRAVVVFTTNLADYAVQGYEVDALGYLLKPISRELLERNLDRALARLRTENTSYLVIEVSGKVTRVPVDDIRYIECVRHYQYIHTSKETHRVITPLTELESQLDPNAFLRCNSGCLVHLKYVETAGRKTVTVDGEVLTISRGKEKDFMAGLTRYLSENI